jgi:hypothetical protein
VKKPILGLIAAVILAGGLGTTTVGLASGIASADPHFAPDYHWCPGERWDPRWGDNWEWNGCHDDHHRDGDADDHSHDHWW